MTTGGKGERVSGTRSSQGIMTEQVLAMYKMGKTVDVIVHEFGGDITPAVVYQILVRNGVDVTRTMENVKEVMGLPLEFAGEPGAGTPRSRYGAGGGRRGRTYTDSEVYLREQAVSAYVGGMTLAGIKSTFGMTTMQVYTLLEEEHVPVRRFASNTLKARIRIEKEVIEMYAPVVGTEEKLAKVWDEETEAYKEKMVEVEIRDSLAGYPLHEITMACGVSNTTIANILIRHGIERRMERGARLRKLEKWKREGVAGMKEWTADNVDTDGFWLNERE